MTAPVCTGMNDQYEYSNLALWEDTDSFFADGYFDVANAIPQQSDLPNSTVDISVDGTALFNLYEESSDGSTLHKMEDLQHMDASELTEREVANQSMPETASGLNFDEFNIFDFDLLVYDFYKNFQDQGLQPDDGINSTCMQNPGIALLVEEAVSDPNYGDVSEPPDENNRATNLEYHHVGDRNADSNTVNASNSVEEESHGSTPNGIRAEPPMRIVRSGRLRYEQQDWERIKPRFIQLYLYEEKCLLEVMGILETEKGFDASEQMFKKQIKRWGLRKNMAKAEKEEALAKMNHLMTSGSQTEQYLIRNIDKVVRYATVQAKRGEVKKSLMQHLGRSSQLVRRDIEKRRFVRILEQAKFMTLEIVHFGSGPAKSRSREVQLSEFSSNSSYNSSYENAIFEHEILRQLSAALKCTDADSLGCRPESLISVEQVMEDARIYMRIDSIKKAFKVYKTGLRTYAAGTERPEQLPIFLLPYFGHDRWQYREIPQVFALLFSHTINNLYEKGHSFLETVDSFQHILPSIGELDMIFDALVKQHDSSLPRNIEIWWTLTIASIQLSRRAHKFRPAWSKCLAAKDSLRSMGALSTERHAILNYEYARALSMAGNTSHALEEYQKALDLSRAAELPRLRIKIILRMAQQLGTRSSTLLEAQQKFSDALNQSMLIFGKDHSHTMLAFTQLLEYCKKHGFSTSNMVPEDTYRQAHNHYLSINDVMHEDDKVEIGSGQDFSPRVSRVYVKSEEDDMDIDLQEIAPAEFYLAKSRKQRSSTGTPSAYEVMLDYSSNEEPDELIETTKVSFEQAIDRQG